MKTILYNPIFINPQAYYVFPRLTRYLQPDNESTAEPANYIGTIEVKVIAYGDTTLKRTYTNTDSIDLSEFKNTWIRISLFTKVGSCVLGEWKIGNMESDLPYIDPEVLASLKAVVIVGNKTNNDSDRAIVKNLVDPDNPFVISNAAYTEGSGVNEDGSYQFDGVDDFVTIPTITGGKQVLMKVNWQSIAGMAILYDQRTNGGFAIFNRDYDTNENKVPAYRARNIGGNTYIDGILNEYIYASQLQNITHNIVELYDPELNIGTLNPKIGSSYLNSNYAQMSLYDFMLFDNISTDDKIKELNEYVGIEAKVELPPYYWDAYGKTNLDEDKATIQQRGVAVGDYDLTNHNHAYEGMSGYNGYPVVFGANKTWENFSSVYSYTSDVTSTTIHITRVKNAGTGLLFSYVKKDGALTNIREIPAFRVTVKGLEGNSKFGYRYLATEDATVETLVYLGNGTHELSKSFTPTEALLDLTRNAWVGIFITPMVEGEVVFDCDITIEVLPEYENGLVYDGVDDYSKNENIPVLTDYTIIAKRLWINKDNPLNEQFIHKGAINTPISESAFMLEYEIANDTYALF